MIFFFWTVKKILLKNKHNTTKQTTLHPEVEEDRERKETKETKENKQANWDNLFKLSCVRLGYVSDSLVRDVKILSPVSDSSLGWLIPDIIHFFCVAFVLHSIL